MAEPPRGGPYTVQFEYRFDRLLPSKLEHAYHLLVPGKRRPVGTVAPAEENLNGEVGRGLRTCIIGSAEGESDHRQSDVAPDRVREGSRLSGAGGMVFEDDGYSGASLTRPGLEAVRDLAAQGQIEAVLVYSPDRLSPQVCLSSPAGGGAGTLRRIGSLSEIAIG